ncbi:hypothetical protein EP47_02510 [Legionella norrlandica]|uniref:N-acyl amino acid synthase FeeM catalytic core domain-containing protein n=1 Tax=Legionella norrlandica TaxID=1498499 RepID=A0A0A2ST84_9GAMM|nr:GNAT family N-acetyltransferase [Legionella norrlandica]KGP62679.1 hypothetical protein EP47_02510 [Legionella norrlandica]
MKENIDIKLISKRDIKQREVIFRLRYYIYSQIYKQSCNPNMNHDLQLFTDKIDDKSYLFLVSINSNPVGTLRVTPFVNLNAQENVILKHHNVPPHYLTENSAIFSFFCILPEYHYTSVTQYLLRTVLIHARDNNIQRIFIESREELVPYYQHYQFSLCSEWVKPEEYSLPVIAMTINIQSLIDLGS